MSYRIRIARTAHKRPDSLPQQVRTRITREIASLSDDPRPPGSLKLSGFADEYRIRVGDYRIRYRIDDKAAEVDLIDVRHRKDVYRP